MAFLLRSLNYGGAERQLVALASGLHRRGREVVVIVFYAGGPLQADLERAGVPVRVLGKGGRWDVGSFAARLVRALREEKPGILHPYLDVPNLIAALLRPVFPRLRIVWGVRASDMDFARYDRFSRITFGMARLASRAADLIIANSWAGQRHHVEIGFPRDRLIVIPNGIDMARFEPRREDGKRVRAIWGVGTDDRLIGLIGRLDPMKDHPTFLRAAAIIARERPASRFLCLGAGPDEYLQRLRVEADGLGIGERVIWGPPRDDMAAVYGALDVLCSASAYGEGFSNVIGEAMACGVPCVVTDVGDSARIVGDLGRVVPAGSAEALADALLATLAGPADSVALRRRIAENFSVENLVASTEAALWPRD